MRVGFYIIIYLNTTVTGVALDCVNTTVFVSSAKVPGRIVPHKKESLHIVHCQCMIYR
jgi:hypothetical protein